LQHLAGHQPHRRLGGGGVGAIGVERGDAVVFVVSGRVHTYRGANHLLLTTVRQPVDAGNLAR
ncbi:MAG: hypothetical protein AAFX76_09975, partial [Planctomycetota bacterium]